MKKITLTAFAGSALILSSLPVRSADASDNWSKNCSACHGSDGAGHTKAGRMAQVKNMTDPVYQKTFTDDQAANQIKSGLKDPSGKEKMKAFGDKFSDVEIKALVELVRSFQK